MQLTFVWWPSLAKYRTASMMEPKTQLTEKQWSLIKNLFPQRPVGPAGGRPAIPPRPCLEGILWLLRNGGRWKDLPERFPSYATCWRRLRDWTRSGVWQKAWARLIRKLDRLGKVRWEQLLADGTFSRAKKGVPRLG